MNVQEIIGTYKYTGSMEKTAAKCNVNWQKVRKILITEGLYETPLSSRINRLYKEGMPVNTIAIEMNMSKTAINSYLPYGKGVYLIHNPTVNALRIRKYRDKERVLRN